MNSRLLDNNVRLIIQTAMASLTLFSPFCEPDQKTQLRKMLHDISEHHISYLQSLPFVDIVEL